MSSSAALSAFMVLCDKYLCLLLRHHPKRRCNPCEQSFLGLPPTPPAAPSNCQAVLCLYGFTCSGFGVFQVPFPSRGPLSIQVKLGDNSAVFWVFLPWHGGCPHLHRPRHLVAWLWLIPAAQQAYDLPSWGLCK